MSKLTTAHDVLRWALTTLERAGVEEDGDDHRTAEYLAECVRLRVAWDARALDPRDGSDSDGFFIQSLNDALHKEE